MDLIKHTNNLHELEFKDGTLILFSYNVPIAMRLLNVHGKNEVWTCPWPTNASKKHLNFWLNKYKWTLTMSVGREKFDEMIQTKEYTPRIV